MLLFFSNETGGEKLEVKRRTIIRFTILVLLSMVCIRAISYDAGFESGKSFVRDYEVLKDAMDYGIYKSFSVEEAPSVKPQNWSTPEELGIVLIKNDRFNSYRIYIVAEHKDKALSWMSDYRSGLYVKYDDRFLEISFRWVTPGLNLPDRSMLFFSICLLIWWIIEALLPVYYKLRKPALAKI